MTTHTEAALRGDSERKRKPRTLWIEGYKCGCQTTKPTKRELPGYCPAHGESRREIYKLP